jgi:hypothetical protein
VAAAELRATALKAEQEAAVTSMSWALAGLIADGGVGTGDFDPEGVRAGTFVGGAGFADTFGATPVDAGATVTGPEEATIASRSRRATGASTVLDADFTYSPISCSLASTVLLSTPSSFASSCTRALPATALLTPRSCGQPASTSLVH